MNKNKAIYTACVVNKRGVSRNAGRDTNVNNLKSRICEIYWPGWTVVISKIENGDFVPVEVERFTILK